MRRVFGITLGTVKALIRQASGGSLQAAQNLADLVSAAASRTNLGLGSAALSNAADFLQGNLDLSDVASAATSRANLGLGGAAILSPGSAIGNVPQIVDVGAGVAGIPAMDGSLLTGIVSGGGISSYDAVVDGTTYSTVGAAVAAGKISILVTVSTTETANIAVPSSFTLKVLFGAIVAMGEFRFTESVASSTLYCGPGTISYAHSSSFALWDINGSSSLNIHGLSIDASGCTATAPIFFSGSAKVFGHGLSITAPNQANASTIWLAGKNQMLSKVSVSGGGASLFVAVRISGGSLSQLYFNATTSTTITSIEVSDALLTDVIWEGPSGIINVGTFGVLSEVNVVGGSSCEFRSNTGESIVSGISGGGSIIANFNGMKTCVSNSVFTAVSTTNGRFSNCLFTTPVTLTIPRTSYTGCQFASGVTLSGKGISLSDCLAGAGVTGGLFTITVDASSTNCQIIGCRTEVSISNLGTGTVLLGNIVY